jgi:uncharacterized membrane protein YtjA (UPF0391 family)
MLLCALVFFWIALAAAIFGFGASMLAYAAVAQFVFYGAIALLVLSLMGHFMRRV